MKTKLIFLGCLLGVMMLPLHAQTFTENFAKEPINQVPSKWSITIGDAGVTVVDDKKSFGLQDNAIVTPKIAGLSNNYLGSEFIIEFDLFFDEAATAYRQFYKLRLWEGKGNFGFDGKHTDPLIIYRHGIRAAGSYKSYNKLKELEINDRVWRHVKLVYSNGGLEVFINDHLLFSNPNLFYQPQMVSIGATLHSSIPLISAFTNFSMIGETENNLDSECGAMPTEEQLQVLRDSTSLFNRRLKFIENIPIDQLRGLRALEYRNDEFILPTRVRFSTSPTDNYTTIPIIAHVIRKSNHKEGLSPNELYASIKRSNELFDKYGVYLQIEKIKYIDDDILFNERINDTTDVNSNNTPDYIELLDIPDKNIKNKLNMYFVENVHTSWANFPDKLNEKQHIIVKNEQAKNESTLTHEIGHWFNLLHTHETVNGRESANGVNCKFAGDFCCDTPADPQLSNKIDDACNYTGTDRDFIGFAYNPDPTNIMSYSKPECRINFSDKQIKRMYNAYLGMEQDRGYSFKIDGQLGEEIATYNWTAGWNNIEYFEIDKKPFMYFFKTSTGELAIHKINNDGTKGAKTGKGEFGNDWSTSKMITTTNGNFLFTMKHHNGLYQIRKIEPDGSLGQGRSGRLDPGRWTPLYTSMSTSYLILIDKENSKIQTFNFNSDGTVGDRLYEKKLANGYDINAIKGSKIIRYNSEDGKILILDLAVDGSFKTHMRPKTINSGFSAMEFSSIYESFYETTDSFYNMIFLNKSNGQIKLYQWKADNTLGEDWYDSSKVMANHLGYDVITPYNLSNGNNKSSFLMLSDSTSGNAIVYKLN